MSPAQICTVFDTHLIMLLNLALRTKKKEENFTVRACLHGERVTQLVGLKEPYIIVILTFVSKLCQIETKYTINCKGVKTLTLRDIDRTETD